MRTKSFSKKNKCGEFDLPHFLYGGVYVSESTKLLSTKFHDKRE